MEGACPSTGSPLSGGLTKHGLQYIEILILQFICDWFAGIGSQSPFSSPVRRSTPVSK